MLDAYLAEFNALIQAPTSPIPLISAAQATTYINAARNQVASEGECIRAQCTLTFVASQQIYGLAAFSPPSGVGIASALAVRDGFIVGGAPVDIRSWEWFAFYYLPGIAAPRPTMAQQGQGTSATFYFSPMPTGGSAAFDCACLPIPLVDDTTDEAIPELWTDAVPFWAAWLGLQSLQRQSDADMIKARYDMLMRRARDEVTPSVLPGNLPGDVGAKLAATKTTLTQAQAPTGRAA